MPNGLREVGKWGMGDLIQHEPSTYQFRCTCGAVITFALNSKAWPMLVNRHSVGPCVITGECPHCHQKHWRGLTKSSYHEGKKGPVKVLFRDGVELAEPIWIDPLTHRQVEAPE